MRPPVKWISRADIRICPTAITCLVSARPECMTARYTGRLVIAPPKNTAAHTCRCVWLYVPSQARGEIQSAVRIPPNHCSSITITNNRSVRW